MGKIPRPIFLEDFHAFLFPGRTKVASKVIVCKCGVDGWSIPSVLVSWQNQKRHPPHPFIKRKHRSRPHRGGFLHLKGQC